METKAGCRETAFRTHINGFLCTIKRKPGQAVPLRKQYFDKSGDKEVLDLTSDTDKGE